MENIVFLILRRMRQPLLTLLVVYALSILGLTLIPGRDADGNVWHMSIFHAFYFVSYMATTIGFGEIPYAFTDAQRLWVSLSLYASVIAWIYAFGTILALVQDNVSAVTFFVLGYFPLPSLTIALVVIAAFLFLVTSVVSAAFVLGMFSTAGDPDPSVRIKLAWGVVLGGLGLVMILSGSIDAVKSSIAVGALPFVFIVLLIVVCFLKVLRLESPGVRR